VWRWPTGGGATVTAYAANDWCETPALPFDYWFFVKDFPPSCKPIQVGTPLQVLRLAANMQAPTPFPQGFSLCEAPCP